MSAFTSLKRKGASTSHAPEFRIVADRICEIASEYKIPLRAYYSPELPLYSQLDPDRQKSALADLKTYLLTMEQAVRDHADLAHAERSLWYALSALGLRAPSDLFKIFKPGDVVEIYDMEGFQIWRNFNFLKICSYTLEEMYAIEWFRRYKREENAIQICQEKVGELISLKAPEIFHAKIGAHRLEETLSGGQLILSASHDVLSRLYDRSGQFCAWLVISTVEITGSANAEIKQPNNEAKTTHKETLDPPETMPDNVISLRPKASKDTEL